MKRVIIIAILLIFSGISSLAQDLITKRNGESIKAKILEVSQSEVKYKRYSNLSGPTFTLSTSEISTITYENGEKDYFSTAKSTRSNTTASNVRPGMSYRQIKRNYNPRYYVHDASDAYSPFWSGLASLIIPGLGQGICREWGRGLGIWAGHFGCMTLFLVGAKAGADLSNAGESPDGPYNLALAALIGTMGIEIWNIFDAAKVAKVKNMYEQDLRAQRASLDLSLEPFFAYSPTSLNGDIQPVAGLSLKLSF